MRCLVPTLLLLLMGGCAAQAVVPATDGLCNELGQRLVGCGAVLPTNFDAACMASDAMEVGAALEAQCDQVDGAFALVPKDVPGGGDGVCVLSVFCDEGLVCRPNRYFINACQPPGQIGEHCWLGGHCTAGLSCHNVWHDEGVIGHPSRVCNPHTDELHPHEPIVRTDCESTAVDVFDPGETASLPGEPVTLYPLDNYDDRVVLQQILFDAHPYPFQGTELAWPDHRAGILFQTRWQAESGRSARRESGWSFEWWPNINLMLTAWQLRALQQGRGELREVELVGVAEAPPAIEQSILDYYDELDAVRRWAEQADQSDHDIASARSRLQALLWKFHSEVVFYGLDENEATLNGLPDGERMFANSWGNTLVELLAIVNFPTDASTIGRFEELTLPYRIVQSGDYGTESDLPLSVRSCLVAMRVLHEFEVRTGGTLKRLLRAAMNGAETSHFAAHMLETALLSGGHDAAHLLVEGIASLVLGGSEDAHCHDSAAPL